MLKAVCGGTQDGVLLYFLVHFVSPCFLFYEHLVPHTSVREGVTVRAMGRSGSKLFHLHDISLGLLRNSLCARVRACLSVFRRVRKIAKSVFSFVMSVRPHGTARPLLSTLSWNLIS